MGYKDRSTLEKADSFDYRILEVRLSNMQVSPPARARMRAVTVDNHLDTLLFIETNLNDCIDNIVRLERMEFARRVRGAE